MEIIKIKTPSRFHTAYIGYNIMPNIGSLLKLKVKGKKVFIISNNKVFKYYGKTLIDSLKKQNFRCSYYCIPKGEKSKNIEIINKIYNAVATARLDRWSTIISLGGGVVGDMAGFVAATYMRGINLVHVPTTLIAQSDSSIGGKTGFDLKYGKNLVGAFYQPILILIDVNTLKSLPEIEFKNGLAEVIKYGIIMDKHFFDFLKKNRNEILKKNKKSLIYIVKKSVQNKAKIVAADERENKGIREILNYGHTLGHAIEAASGYKSYKHGQAITIGMILAAYIAYDLGFCDKSTLSEQIQIFNSFNLIKPLRNIKKTNILKRLLSDKKVINDKIRFVLTKKIGYANFIQSIKISAIKKALQRQFY